MQGLHGTLLHGPPGDLLWLSGAEEDGRRHDDDDDDGTKGPSKAAKRRAADNAKASADRAQIAHLKAVTNGEGKFSKGQKKRLSVANKVLALTNGGVGVSEAPNRGAQGGKSQGKGKSKWHTKTPESKMLCFGFNKGGCTRPSCNMEHKCQVCFGDHPATDCPKSKSG